jgi:hypothetical protein
MTVRIVMWSTPRSLSTAPLRSWANRVDTTVVDEPFYGAWLHEKNPNHPSAQELARTLATDRLRVAQQLRVSGTTPLQYEKHITQHVSVPFVADQMQGVRHAFLVRHPARQLTSLAKVLGTFPFESSGWPMLEKLHLAFGGGAPILDADAIGEDPARALRLLCAALSVEFSESMLAWSPGKHPALGSWAGDWYHAVQASSGFTPPGPLPEVPPHLSAYYAQALPVYERMYAERLK